VYIAPGRTHIALKQQPQIEKCSIAGDGFPECEAALCQDDMVMPTGELAGGLDEIDVQSDVTSMISGRTGSTHVFKGFYHFCN